MSRGFVFSTSNQQTFWRYGGGLFGASKKSPGRHQIQNAEGPVLDPCAKQVYFRRDLKVGALRIESGPS